jgi:hypothetical protein
MTALHGKSKHLVHLMTSPAAATSLNASQALVFAVTLQTAMASA